MDSELLRPGRNNHLRPARLSLNQGERRRREREREGRRERERGGSIQSIQSDYSTFIGRSSWMTLLDISRRDQVSWKRAWKNLEKNYKYSSRSRSSFYDEKSLVDYHTGKPYTGRHASLIWEVMGMNKTGNRASQLADSFLCFKNNRLARSG